MNVSGADDLGNTGTVDAGSLIVSRWAFSFAGGSLTNGFSVSKSGWLVIPRSATNEIAFVGPSGMLAGIAQTRYAPTENVSIGQSNPEYVFSFEHDTNQSTGRFYDLASAGSGGIGGWAIDAQRGRQFAPASPILTRSGASELVSIAFNDSLGVRAAFATHPAGGVQSGTTAPAFSSDAGSLLATGSSRGLFVSDGSRVVLMRNPANPQPGPPLDFPATFAAVQMAGIGRDEVAGIGPAAGGFGAFVSNAESRFQPYDGQLAERLDHLIVGADSIFFSRSFGSFSVVCSSTVDAGTLNCAQPVLQDTVTALALGKALYAVVARQLDAGVFVQVRSPKTLILGDEYFLPGVDPAGCRTLTPTCMNGVSVIGCIDARGKIAFVYTEKPGLDPSAPWPMEGHDPSRTQNTGTDLTPFVCQ